MAELKTLVLGRKNIEDLDDRAEERLFAFLATRSDDGRLHLDDDAVLDFWLSHAADRAAGNFRLYETVCSLFLRYLKALELERKWQAVGEAAVCRGVATQQVDDVVCHLLGIRAGQIHFVQNRNDFQVVVQGQVQV